MADKAAPVGADQVAAADAATASKQAKVKAAQLHTTRGDYGSSSSLRTFWDFTDLDRDRIRTTGAAPSPAGRRD